MNVKHLLALLLAPAFSILFTLDLSANEACATCPLPPPQQVYVVNATTNSVTFGWSVVSATAASYRIVFEDVTSSTVMSTNYTDAHFATISNVPQGHVVRCNVSASACTAGPYGQAASAMGQGIIIIDDIITQNSGSCTQTGNTWQVCQAAATPNPNGPLTGKKLNVSHPGGGGISPWSVELGVVLIAQTSDFRYDILSAPVTVYSTQVAGANGQKEIHFRRRINQFNDELLFKIKNINMGISQACDLMYTLEAAPAMSAASISHCNTTFCVEGNGGCPPDGQAASTTTSKPIVLLGAAEDRTGSPALPQLTLALSPNPYHDVFNVRFDLQTESQVTLTISDAAGRQVLQILDRTTMAAGEHLMPIEANDLKPGLYWVALNSGGTPIAKRLVKTK